MTCKHCGIATPRLTLTQRYCPPCEKRIADLIESDTRRWNRFRFAKAMEPA